MSVTVANTTICPALAGQDALITITYTSYTTNAASIFIGQKATNIAGQVGYISEIPFGGTQFKVKPQYATTRFDTAGTTGQLAAENIILG